MWCGDSACEDKIKGHWCGVKSRCILRGTSLSDVCVCCGKPQNTWSTQIKQY